MSDSYEEGSFQASKTMTVTRMATRGAPSLLTLLKHCGGGGGGGTQSAGAYIIYIYTYIREFGISCTLSLGMWGFPRIAGPILTPKYIHPYHRVLQNVTRISGNPNPHKPPSDPYPCCFPCSCQFEFPS